MIYTAFKLCVCWMIDDLMVILVFSYWIDHTYTIPWSFTIAKMFLAIEMELILLTPTTKFYEPLLLVFPITVKFPYSFPAITNLSSPDIAKEIIGKC